MKPLKTANPMKQSAIPIERTRVAAYRIPTDAPESDGTLAWDSTILVLMHITAGGETGIGYTYADSATARLVNDKLIRRLVGQDDDVSRQIAATFADCIDFRLERVEDFLFLFISRAVIVAVLGIQTVYSPFFIDDSLGIQERNNFLSRTDVLVRIVKTYLCHFFILLNW